MSRIDKQSPIPYYIQLADILRRRINASPISGQQVSLPSENELVRVHQISRATVRQSLKELEREGLIYKAKGKGTYIAKHRVRYSLNQLISTTEDMIRRGWIPGIKVISFKERDAYSPVADALEIDETEKVYELCRLRLGNEEPVGLQWAYLPVKMCPGLIDLDLTASLTRMMEGKYGVRFWTAREFLGARLPTKFETKHLEIPADLPVIYMERITFSSEDQPAEFLRSIWRSDRYEYEFSLTRPSSG
jgi:GntR family transcriptional regulator